MKQVYLSYHDIHTDCIELAKIIKKKFKPEKLIFISRGGLIPGSIIANYLGIQDIDVIAMKTYSNRKRTNKIEIFKRIKSQKKLSIILKDEINIFSCSALFFASLLGFTLKAIITALDALANVTSVSVTMPISDKSIFGFTSSCLI